MLFDRLRYEVRLMWKPLFLVPLTFLALIGLFVLLQYALKQSITRTLLSEVEIFLPLAAGLVVGTAIAQDAALELQLTMSRKYANTGLLRLGLIFGWTACLSLLYLGIIVLLKFWEFPPFMHSWAPFVKLLTLQLIWLPPLLWFVTLGLLLALLTQSRTATGTLLGGFWLVDILFVSTLVTTAWLRPLLLFPTTLIIYPTTHISPTNFNTNWLTTRFELLGMSLLFFALGWLLLQNTERLLKGTTTE